MYIVITKPHESAPAGVVGERVIGPFEDCVDVLQYTAYFNIKPENYLVFAELGEIPIDAAALAELKAEFAIKEREFAALKTRYPVDRDRLMKFWASCGGQRCH